MRSMRHLFSVSCLLPSSEEGGRKIQASTALESGIAGPSGDVYDVQRVGWTGLPAPAHAERETLSKQLLVEHSQAPIFMEKGEIRGFYNGFCHTSLWPLLHYISSYARYDEQWYTVYRAINERFADKVIERYRTDDLVWVHDYHLMLVPQFIKARRPDARVGFFFHTPFPSYELFRCHPNRRELLAGVLSADLIGFQAFGYLRHFRSTVLRLLGIESELNQIPHAGEITSIGVYPVGVKCALIEGAKHSDDYMEFVTEYQETFADKQVVLSVDRLDYSQGLQKKLKAIETYLGTHPESRRNVVFIVLASPSGVHSEEVDQLEHDVEHAVGRINGHFSTIDNIPVHYMNKWLSFNQVCALYTLADVALVTPLMDGMNVIAKEYVACKGEESNGVLILSEFAGASEELFNAIRVNPYNNSEMTTAIDRALCMPEEEKQKRLQSMLQRVTRYDATYWASSFVHDLVEASEPADDTTTALNDEVLASFRDPSLSKALFLDYDGSLREFVDTPEDAVPSPDLIEIFEGFDRRDDLDVYIVSGRDRDFLEKHFGRFSFTLVGEHGFFTRLPGQGWESMAGDIDLSWKETIKEIFEMYSVSTPSTKVEEKHSAVVWHYRQADPEFGEWKAASLIGELTETISNLPVAIHQGQKIVEVSSQHVNKGIAVARFIHEKDYDLTLCAGDDKTDETMLYFDDPHVITVKVGNKDTEANYRVSTPQAFRDFLRSIKNGEPRA